MAYHNSALHANTFWVLKTEGDIQGRIRTFLEALWHQAKLDGMIVPVYEGTQGLPGPKLLWRPEELIQADPLVPLVRMETSKIVEEFAQKQPRLRLGAVLHSCEARALAVHMEHKGFNLESWLRIGVDCLASFPLSDYAWRVDRAGGVRELTQEVLRNARQGGISTDRFRSACQMCTCPGTLGVDLCIGVLGMPVKEYALVKVGNPALLEHFNLEQILDGRAPDWLVKQHDRVLSQVLERHERVKQRMQAGLDEGLPHDLLGWMEHLKGCENCQACLEACPLYTDQLEAGVEAVSDWLLNCVACGICDDVCPKQLPLTAIIERIVHNLQVDPAPA